MGRDHFPNIPIGAGMGFSKGVLLLEDCEGTFTWTVAGTGGDDVHAFATTAAWQGTYGMHLRTRTTLAAADDDLTVTKLMPMPESGLLVARLRIASPDPTAVKSVQIALLANAGANSYVGQLKFAPNTPTVEYVNAAGALVDLPTLATICPADAFQVVELALDVLTMQYIYVLVNGVRVDLAAVPLWDIGAVAARYSYISILVEAIGAAPATLYADNIYVGEYLES